MYIHVCKFYSNIFFLFDSHLNSWSYNLLLRIKPTQCCLYFCFFNNGLFQNLIEKLSQKVHWEPNLYVSAIKLILAFLLQNWYLTITVSEDLNPVDRWRYVVSASSWLDYDSRWRSFWDVQLLKVQSKTLLTILCCQWWFTLRSPLSECWNRSQRGS